MLAMTRAIAMADVDQRSGQCGMSGTGGVSTRSAPRAILAAVFGVTGILLASKLVGFTEKIIVAHYLGTSRSADCYYAAFAVVWTLVYVVRELVHPVGLPVYLEVRRQGAIGDGDRLLSTAGGGLVCVLVVFAAGLAIWPHTAVRIIAPGFADDAHAETAQLLRFMAGGAALLTMTALTRTVLDAHKRFCWAAGGELSFRAVTVGVLAAGFAWHGVPYAGAALALGAAAGLLVHGWALRHEVTFSRPAWTPPIRAALGRMMLLGGPLVVGVVSSHISLLIDGMLASTLSEGRLASLTYAKKLTDAIVMLGPAALATVMFSHFSSLAVTGRHEEMKHLLTRCLRVVVLVAVPVSIAVVMLRLPIVRILFEHGHFDASSTHLSAAALACYGLGIVAFALDGLIVGTFYALKDMKTPVLVGLVCVAANVALAWLLMGPLDHGGIALALTATKTTKVIALAALLHHRSMLAGDLWRLDFWAPLAGGGALMVVAIAFCERIWSGPLADSGAAVQALLAVCVGAAGASAFAGVLAWCAVPEAREVARLLYVRVTSRPQSGGTDERLGQDG